MLQSIPANENGFINSVNGKSYQEYNKWLKGALENSLQEGVIDGCKILQPSITPSCGKKAIPLALLGAEVTIFDISKHNKGYIRMCPESSP